MIWNQLGFKKKICVSKVYKILCLENRQWENPQFRGDEEREFWHQEEEDEQDTAYGDHCSGNCGLSQILRDFTIDIKPATHTQKALTFQQTKATEYKLTSVTPWAFAQRG